LAAVLSCLCGGAFAAQEALHRLEGPGAEFFASYENDGFSMRLRPGEGASVLAEIHLGVPERSAAPLPLPKNAIPSEASAWLATMDDPLPAPAVEEVWRLLRGVEGADESIDRLASWVASHVRYDRERRSETASETWRRRRGSCVGRANLLVSMLRLAGVPARTAHGLALDASKAEQSFHPDMLHRWVEAWRPGGGWRYLDPGEREMRVPATCLPFRAIPRMRDMRGLRVSTLWFTDGARGRAPAGAPEEFSLQTVNIP
jgi:hypothetical protein